MSTQKNRHLLSYDCSKNGLNDCLLITSDFPFAQSKFRSYFVILRQSLLSNINNLHVSLLKSKDEYTFITRSLLLNVLNNDLTQNDVENSCDFLLQSSSRIFQYPDPHLIF
jgi:hypothetical protein